MKKIMILAFTMLMLVGCSNGSGASANGENKTPSNKTLSNTEAMEFLEKASKVFDESMTMYQEELDSYGEFPYKENGESKIEEYQNHGVKQVNRVNDKDVFLYETELLDDADLISIVKCTNKKEILTHETFKYLDGSCSNYTFLEGELIGFNNYLKSLLEEMEKFGEYYTFKLEETDKSYILTTSLSDMKGYNDALTKMLGFKPTISLTKSGEREVVFLKVENEFIFDKDYNLIKRKHTTQSDLGNNMIGNEKMIVKYKKLDKMKYSYEEVMKLLSQAKQQAE